MAKQEKVRLDFERMAQLLMFNQAGFIKYIRGDIRAEFRKGKGPDDINKASQKALKNGHGKTEFELGMLELYLKDVFKVYGVRRNT